jgi:hypothetical protein
MRKRGLGKSDCVRFQPGYRFTMDEHGRASFNQKYLLTKVKQAGRQPQVLGASAPGEGSSYSNIFICIPAEVPYRPPREAHKPLIEGTQTAIVVGPEGEEIYTDEYGRVKVSFHWDREGESNEKSSCWIRVSSAWAGAGWGAIQIPRIGQEVIVDFLEGDPDRPIITGRVYNGTHRAPHALPSHKTKSTLKSNSSKGGGGFNEIRLEDKKGEEQIFVHAEKDQDLRIKNDRFEWVGHNRHQVVKQDKFEHVENNSHRQIDSDQFERINNDRSLNIGGKQAIAIEASYSFTVGDDVIEIFKAHHNEQTTETYYLKANGTIIEATGGITLKCGGSSVVIDSGGVTVTGPSVTVDGSLVKIAAGPGTSPMTGTAKSAATPAAPQPAREADTAYFKKAPAVEKRAAVEGHGGAIEFASSVESGESENPPETSPLPLAAGTAIAVGEEAGIGIELGALARRLLTGLRVVGAGVVGLGASLSGSVAAVMAGMLIPRTMGDSTTYMLTDDLRITHQSDETHGDYQRKVDGEWQSTGVMATSIRDEENRVVGFEGLSEEALAALGLPPSYPVADRIDPSSNFPIAGHADDSPGGFQPHEENPTVVLGRPVPGPDEISPPITGFPVDSGVKPNSVMMSEAPDKGFTRFTGNYDEHIVFRDYDVPRKRGIGGAHNRDEFLKYSNEYKIEEVIPHPSVDGIETIRYRMSSLDPSGNPTGGYRAAVLEKTVYDPAKITNKQFMGWGRQAAAEAQAVGKLNREWVGTAPNGLEFRGYLDDTGAVKSFFPNF